MSEAAEPIEPEAGKAPEVVAAEPAAAEVLSNVEEAARAGGWLPKDEYQGPPDKWLDAPHFVLKAAEILPNVTRDLREARNEIREVKKTLKEFGEYHSQTAQREYQRALTEIEGRLSVATATNDAQGVRDAAEDLADLKAQAKRAPTETSAADPLFVAWQEANAWYGTDEDLTRATNRIAQQAFDDGYTRKAQLVEVDRRLREEFPAKFAKAENPNRRNAAAVEGGTTPVRRTGKSRSDLPANARETMDRWIKQGLVTEAQYLKDYPW